MSGTAGPRSARGAVCLGLLAAAALLWGSSATVWYRVAAPGRPPVELTGAQVSAAPAAVALFALAGIAAVVGTRGPLRRAVGLLLAAAGAAVGAVLVSPFAAGGPRPPPGTAGPAGPEPPAAITAAPLLGLAGAALLLVLGLFVVLAEPRLARLGSGYGRGQQRSGEIDPDRTAWLAQDAGQDPTAGPARPRPDGTGDGGPDRAV